MTNRRRWIESALREAAKPNAPMPWVRGTRRAAWIARRDARDEAQRKSA